LPILTSFARTMTTPDKREHIVADSRGNACSGSCWRGAVRVRWAPRPVAAG
jgi:hypothetical protein